jgi:hypothetical protein
VKRINLDLDVATHARLKSLAARRRMTLKELLLERLKGKRPRRVAGRKSPKLSVTPTSVEKKVHEASLVK